MVYPMPLAYDDERIERRDYEYMKSLYPDVAKRILPYVEEECDRCDCPCSMMYDEYPDRLQLRLMCNRIYDKVCENEKMFFTAEGYDDVFPEKYDEVEGQQLWEDDRRERMRRPDCFPEEDRDDRRRRFPEEDRDDRRRRFLRRPDWLRNLIEVMTYQELYKRRQNDRRNRRKFY